MMERVIAYIDGFNLYFGLRSKKWKKYYWLNIQAMIQRITRNCQSLEKVKYFTAHIKRHPAKVRRQNIFLEALGTLADFDIFYGRFLESPVTCRKCGHVYQKPQEKMTDVNIAVQMLTDAFQDRFDIAFLVSADSDLAGPIDAIKTLFPSKKVLVIFPPERHSTVLQNTAHARIRLTEEVLKKSQFPDEVVKSDGFALKRPASWK